MAADVSILGLGLGGAFVDGYERNLDAGDALLESALALGINYWDTARSYGPTFIRFGFTRCPQICWCREPNGF
jgi:aryl-alcohol dehydrogenase-like predicted oxidoreductase